MAQSQKKQKNQSAANNLVKFAMEIFQIEMDYLLTIAVEFFHFR